MKIISFTYDGKDYVVVISNIEYITPNLQSTGSVINLTSGKVLFTKMHIDDLTKKLEEA